MNEPKRILAVTDLGPGGEVAVRAGAARARELGVAFAVVHAMPSLDTVRMIFPERLADDALRQATLPQNVRTALEQHVAECAPDGPPADVFLSTGNLAEVALIVATRWEADLVISGAPEAGMTDADRIVRHAGVPVMIAREGPARGAVVACTDFSDPSLPAVRTAANEARRTGDPLYVIHAMEPLSVAIVGIEGYGVVRSADWERERREDAERRLAAALAAVEVCGTYVALDGPVVPSLITWAREREARLMVIGTIGRTGLTRFLLGSVAEALIREAPCSTLVVRLHRDRS